MTTKKRFTQDDVLKAVTAKGITSEGVAEALGMTPRTARIHLAKLFNAGRVQRTGAYTGSPPVFHYVYRRQK
jgi:predicted ArsR family transcriptional regulator